MDTENSMVVGAQDVYDGCGRAHDRSSGLDEAREYFYTDEGMLELHEHLLDVGYGMILQHLVLAAHSSTSAAYNPTYSAKAINVVERAIEFLAKKKVNGVHQ